MKTKMKLSATLALACVLALAGYSVAKEKDRFRTRKPVVQIALLLDTSNSMDGLINQARSHLWKIVNEFATAKRGGKSPELQVALYEYGKSSLPAESGFIREVVPFTVDLDKISKELFDLKTNGGDEYCGWVIERAVGSADFGRDALSKAGDSASSREKGPLLM